MHAVFAATGMEKWAARVQNSPRVATAGLQVGTEQGIPSTSPPLNL